MVGFAALWCGSASIPGIAHAQTVLPPVTVVSPDQQRVRHASAPKQTASRIRRASLRHGSGSAPLQPVAAANVSRAVNPSAAIGAPPPVYAGGQVASGQRIGLLGNRSFMDTPFSTTSYTAQYIADQQARTLGDVLASDPTVRPSLPTTGYADQISLRGFTLYTSDGTLDGLAGIVPERRFPFDSIERVEILRGPAALLVGVPPGASIAGTINYVPKRATDDPITRLTANYFSDAEFGTSIDVGRRYGEHKEWGVRFNGSFRDGDTPQVSQSEHVGNATVGLDYRGDKFRFSVDAGYVDQYEKRYSQIIMSILPGSVVPPAPASNTTLSQPWQTVAVNSAYGMFRAEYDVLDNTTVGVGYGHSSSNERSVQTVLTSLQSNGNLLAIPAVLPYWYDNDSADVSVRSKFDTGPLTHQVAVTGNILSSAQSIINTHILGAPVLQNIYQPFNVPEPNTSGIGHGGKTSQATLSSAAIADVISMLGDRVQVTVGGRQQHIDVESFSPVTGAPAASFSSDAFSPAYGLLLKPTRQLSLYANYIQGLVQGLTAPVGTANAGQIFRPALAEQREVGAKLDLGGFGAQLALFEITQQTGSTDAATNIFDLNGLQRNRGVEIQTFGQLAPNARLLGGVSFIDGRLTQTPGGIFDGRKAPGVPDVQVTIAPELDVPDVPGLTMSTRAIYTSGVFFDPANTQAVPSWTRYDVGARYKTTVEGRPATFRASVENILDHNYWQVAGRSLLSLGSARTYLVSATFDF
jgi:iron complex outermembrane receptor protein